MINNYYIKKINNHDVLCINFNFNYEFASFNLKEKKKNIINDVKKYLNKYHIIFNGTLILLICGNIIFGKLNYNDLNIKNNYNMIIPITNEIAINDKNTDYLYIDDLNIIDTDNINNIDSEVNNDNINITEPIINIEDKNSTEQVFNDEYINDDEPVNDTIDINENIDNNIYVNVRRKNGEIINLELEEYVIGVVAAEMPAEFNIEALKAQAVISRTYALKTIKDNKILTDNEKTQSYMDNNELHERWQSNYNKYMDKIRASVLDTKGIYLSYNNEIAEAVFHSTSNGYTESSLNVWGNYYSYLVSVPSIYDNLNPSYYKDYLLSYDELSSKLNMNITYETEINILSKSESGRVLELEIEDKIIKGTEFRALFQLRSTAFTLDKNENGINIITEGYGHGVGMSQYGANGYAKNGYSYIDILYHYYPGIELSKID